MWYAVLGFVLALYVLVDGLQRQLSPVVVILYAAGTFFAWPLIAPLYFARRPLKAGAVRAGGTFYVWAKGFAAIWTLGMIAWAISGTSAALSQATESSGLATAIGTGAGLSLICVVWIVPLVVLGVLAIVFKTDNVEEGPTGPLAK